MYANVAAFCACCPPPPMLFKPWRSTSSLTIASIEKSPSLNPIPKLTPLWGRRKVVNTFSLIVVGVAALSRVTEPVSAAYPILPTNQSSRFHSIPIFHTGKNVTLFDNSGIVVSTAALVRLKREYETPH